MMLFMFSLYSCICFYYVVFTGKVSRDTENGLGQKQDSTEVS